MFGKSKDGSPEGERVAVPPAQESSPPRPTPVRAVPSPDADQTSLISAGMTIVGKISGEGSVQIFGRVEGELHASTVMVSPGAEVEGDIVADDVTVGGRVKGTVHANRVKLNSTAVVEGDIFHRSLSIEENARFEGSSRREDAAIDTPRIPLNRSPSQFPSPNLTSATHNVAADTGQKRNGAPENGLHATPAAS